MKLLVAGATAPVAADGLYPAEVPQSKHRHQRFVVVGAVFAGAEPGQNL
jgi:hypothetical protein